MTGADVDIAILQIAILDNDILHNLLLWTSLAFLPTKSFIVIISGVALSRRLAPIILLVDLENRMLKVFICCASSSAHLACLMRLDHLRWPVRCSSWIQAP